MWLIIISLVIIFSAFLIMNHSKKLSWNYLKERMGVLILREEKRNWINLRNSKKDKAQSAPIVRELTGALQAR